jgi:AcrR family transcriptional regulator
MSAHGDPAPWAEPLKRGRHKLPAEAVRASQRERLLRAVIEVVADRGYEATTILAVVTAARVSRSAFYECFADKVDCFLAAIDDSAGELLREVSEAGRLPTWTQAARHGTRTYLRWWEKHPAFQRACFLGLPGVGGEQAQMTRDRIFASFRRMFDEIGRRARIEQDGLAPLAPIIPDALVFAITDVVAARCRAGGSLADLEPEVLYLLVKLLADEATAQEVVRGGSAGTDIGRP